MVMDMNNLKILTNVADVANIKILRKYRASPSL